MRIIASVWRADQLFKVTWTVTDQFSVGGSIYYSPSVLNSGADGEYLAGTAKYVLPADLFPKDWGMYVSGDVGHWFEELESGETPGQQLVLELAAPTHLAHDAEVRVPHPRS